MGVDEGNLQVIDVEVMVENCPINSRSCQIEDRLFYRGRVRTAMATRKGINISGNYTAPHILHALFIYVLCM